MLFEPQEIPAVAEAATLQRLDAHHARLLRLSSRCDLAMLLAHPSCGKR